MDSQLECGDLALEELGAIDRLSRDWVAIGLLSGLL